MPGFGSRPGDGKGNRFICIAICHHDIAVAPWFDVSVKTAIDSAHDASPAAVIGVLAEELDAARNEHLSP